LRRRIDLRTYVAARNRIDLAVEQTPLLQRDDVDFVEGAKALLGERSRRAQLAGAERRQRPAGLGDQPLDPLETLLQRHWAVESPALDSVTRKRRRPARKLKDTWQKAIAPCGKIDCTGHGAPPQACALHHRCAGRLRQVCLELRPPIKDLD